MVAREDIQRNRSSLINILYIKLMPIINIQYSIIMPRERQKVMKQEKWFTERDRGKMKRKKRKYTMYTTYRTFVCWFCCGMQYAVCYGQYKCRGKEVKRESNAISCRDVMHNASSIFRDCGWYCIEYDGLRRCGSAEVAWWMKEYMYVGNAEIHM